MASGASKTLKPLSLRSAGAPTERLVSKSALALGISAAFLSSAAVAQDTASTELNTVQVKDTVIDTNPYAEPEAPYKAKVSGDARHVKPLAETPQTINVLTKTQIEDSGRTDLKEVLQAQPGITVGTGENGNAFGDRYIIRGYEARSDVFVDGLRDPGMTIRETFATEQVEISKGPSSTFAGRGTVGGAINSITKQASTEYDFTDAKIGMGTDEYRRVELDANHTVNDKVATRINLLQAYEEVPNRDPADRDREGIALSMLVKPTDKFDIITDVYHLNAEDKPDLGTYIEANGGKPVKDIPVYLQSQDFLKSEVNIATVRMNYLFNEDFRVSNAVRYGTTDNGYVTTGARGTTRGTNDAFPGVATVTLSSHQGWQDVEYLADQLNFFYDTQLGGMKHQFIFGTEFSDVNVINGVYTGLTAPNNANANCVTGTTATTPNGYCIKDANGNWLENVNNLMGRSITKGTWDSDYQVKTWSFSVMDTVEITDKLDIFAGVRLDSFDYSNTTQNTNTRVETEYKYDDRLYNYHLGAVYDVTKEGNVYLTYSTASEINGGESDLGASCGYGGVCTISNNPELVKDSKPEDTTNIELGTKWNLLDEKLLATAALFQITKDDVMEGITANSYATTGSLNTGKNRVEGIEVGLSGNITEQLSTQFGATVMDAEVMKSVVDPDSKGRTLSNFAEKSLFVQMRYALTDKFAFGGTATYTGERYAGQPDSAAAYNTTTDDYSFEVPSYKLFDLFAEYEFSDKLNARLNVQNVTDEDYYLATYRSGAFTYIGDARRAFVTLEYDM